jgi:hypothetical protein
MADDDLNSDQNPYGNPNDPYHGAPTDAPGNNENQIAGWFSNYMGRPATNADVAFWAHQAQINAGGLSWVQNQLANSPEAQKYGSRPGGSLNPTAPTPPAAPPAPVPPFSGVTYPGFTPPPLPDALKSPFQLPTADDLVKNDPGYMARYQLGQKSIERSAASRGTVLNPGTLQALQQAGQDYASNEYNTYVNQKLGERNQQSTDYLNLAYGPSWQTNSAAVNQYGQLYKQYGDLITNNRNAQNDYIDQLIRQQQVGVNAAGAPPTSSTSNV